MRSKREGPPKATYDRQFYDVINAGSAKSAALIAPAVLNIIGDAGHPVRSVVDVGCGEGVWAAEFAKHVDHVVGIDGEYVDPERVQIENFVQRNLELRMPSVPSDLAISLEVAEHLTPGRAASFIAELTEQAPVVLFSAAIPGQGGTGHINEQWPAYWDEFFTSVGYAATGALRWLFWEQGARGEIENWYCQNLLLAVRRDWVPDFEPSLFFGPHTYPLPVVHPVLWDARR